MAAAATSRRAAAPRRLEHPPPQRPRSGRHGQAGAPGGARLHKGQSSDGGQRGGAGLRREEAQCGGRSRWGLGCGGEGGCGGLAQPRRGSSGCRCSQSWEGRPRAGQQVVGREEAGVRGCGWQRCGQRAEVPRASGATVPPTTSSCMVDTSSRQEAGFTRAPTVPDKNSTWEGWRVEGVQGALCKEELGRCGPGRGGETVAPGELEDRGEEAGALST